VEFAGPRQTGDSRRPVARSSRVVRHRQPDHARHDTRERMCMRNRLSTPARLALAIAAAASALAGLNAGIAAPATAASCANGYVALTYDDGPHAGTTTALLDGLKAGGAKATFFVSVSNAPFDIE